MKVKVVYQLKLWFLRKNKAPKFREKQKKNALFEGRERVLHAFETKIFAIKTEGTGFFRQF